MEIKKEKVLRDESYGFLSNFVFHHCWGVELLMGLGPECTSCNSFLWISSPPPSTANWCEKEHNFYTQKKEILKKKKREIIGWLVTFSARSINGSLSFFISEPKSPKERNQKKVSASKQQSLRESERERERERDWTLKFSHGITLMGK